MAASKLSFLRNALESRVPPQSLPLIRRIPLRCLSTEGEAPQDNASEDPFLRTPEAGLAFAKLTGIRPHTLKTDVINYLEGCNLSTNDVKVEYTKGYNPIGMLLQFSSRSAFDIAMRQNAKKGRLYKLEMISRSDWDLTTSYDGKAVVLQGLPRNSTQEDMERFLCGCNFDPSTFNVFLRPGIPDPVKIAFVQFATRIDAMNAFRLKNRSFCLNNPITIRVLH
ncbi:hypothetical protein Cni_G09396 [Canna indica]|uniref:RRM domain-containing protein n=1 Tax=Canna indica TaxID=4628 RepID=A0AAQ3K4P2_9LILI|nr:hypothetical protein Cni_G09396 [Canna indica]